MQIVELAYPFENVTSFTPCLLEVRHAKRKHIAYDANGNQLEILEEVKDPSETQGYRLQSLRKNLWDAEDRLRAVDLNPEADSDKPLIAVYTYDAGGERTIKYVPARTDARYSAKNTGNADRFESIIYPNALITAKALDFVEQLEYRKDPKVVNYTNHYYIGSERIASSIGTYRGTGGYPLLPSRFLDLFDDSFFCKSLENEILIIEAN